MSKVYYCSNQPLDQDHQQFYGSAISYNIETIDCDGNLLGVDSLDGGVGPSEYSCCDCDALAIYGVKPSALELLAKAAED